MPTYYAYEITKEPDGLEYGVRIQPYQTEPFFDTCSSVRNAYEIQLPTPPAPPAPVPPAIGNTRVPVIR